MKNKIWLVFIALVLVISSVGLAACGEPAPSPTPAEPIKLRLGHGMPPVVGLHTTIIVPWAERINERTKAIGKPVEITIFPAEALFKIADSYDACVKGTADIISIWAPFLTPGLFPASEIMQMPFLFPNATVAAQVAWELVETQPAIREELSGVKVLFSEPASPAMLSARTAPVKTLEDFKGRSVHSEGAAQSDWWKALGATPVVVVTPEVYPSLERGVLDIVGKNWELVFSAKWYEVTKYRTSLSRGLNISNLYTAMNWDSWNSLPPEVQKIFEEESGASMSKLAGETFDKNVEHFIGLITEYDKKVGNPEIYQLPDEELQRWEKAVTPVYEKWITDMEANGISGRSIFEDIHGLVDKYSK